MVVRISRPLLDAICTHAEDTHPFECCGLLLGRRSDAVSGARVPAEVVEICPTKNVAAHPEHRFEVDPAVLIKAHRAAREGGLEVVGHYHSHPKGEAVPSAVDAAMAQVDGEIWIVVGRSGEVRGWRAKRGGELHGCFGPVELTGSPQPPLAPAELGGHEGSAVVL
jgi:proteasome lid subunit RPN8/RPN11